VFDAVADNSQSYHVIMPRHANSLELLRADLTVTAHFYLVLDAVSKHTFVQTFIATWSQTVFAPAIFFVKTDIWCITSCVIDWLIDKNNEMQAYIYIQLLFAVSLREICL